MMTLLTSPRAMIRTAEENAKQLVEPKILAIYDSVPNQIGTGFVVSYNAKPVLITAKHTLYGHSFNENPLDKQIHFNNSLKKLGDLSVNRIVEDNTLDVALMYIDTFPRERCFYYTSLKFGREAPKLITIYGFLSSRFKRSGELDQLMPKPFRYSGKRVSLSNLGYSAVGIKYLKRKSIRSYDRRRVMAPIPAGLSGSAMICTSSLLLGKVSIYGVFTSFVRHKGYVFGTHISELCSLMKLL